MHTIHHTDAVITKIADYRETSKRVWLFTRDFGLIIAVVQGVRNQGAKLQMHLREYALVRADIVRGREVWRLTGVHVHSEVLLLGRSPRNRAYVRLLSFIQRFVVGEDPHPELFAHVVAVAQSLPMLSGHREMDALALWRALALLGYIAVTPRDEALLTSPFVEATVSLDNATLRQCILQADSAIAQSHL
ncbi:MAG TPA: recombination protein O N-terminal domain-containing protein [Candidatus Paceibacterota bacterium]|nr:recombination protein O N-terminal domain-containing protein [Candidatus Paceibacterota bacterium]